MPQSNKGQRKRARFAYGDHIVRRYDRQTWKTTQKYVIELYIPQHRYRRATRGEEGTVGRPAGRNWIRVDRARARKEIEAFQRVMADLGCIVRFYLDTPKETSR